MTTAEYEALARRQALRIKAVEKLHTERRRDVDGYTLRWCVECQQNWPCPTYQAVADPYPERAGESEYRSALHDAQRALMYAVKRITPEDYSISQAEVVRDALAEVNRVLDIGRDESREQIAT